MSAAPRLFVPLPLADGAALSLPEAASRHVQVLRLQPGGVVVLFDGSGAEWRATIARMGKREVAVDVGARRAGVDRELRRDVSLAVAMPANDRMDGLVEKATELGVARIQPLVCERSVLRLDARRAAARAVHWQAVATAACEQCGRTRVPVVEVPSELRAWLAARDVDARGGVSLVLSLDDAARPPASIVEAAAANAPLVALSGPEGGLTADEEALAVERGFVRCSLGRRVLRADTAPLALLAWLGVAGLTEPAEPDARADPSAGGR